jgi:hypothetical protein
MAAWGGRSACGGRPDVPTVTRVLLSLLLVLGLAGSAAAQHPLLGTTLQTTDTSANSVLVGCTVGSTTCTGGVKAGAIASATVTTTGAGSFASLAVTAGATVGGTLGVTGALTGNDFVISSIATGGAFKVIETGATTNQKNTLFRAASGIARLSFCDGDPITTCADAWTVSRSGTTPQAMAINAALIFTNTITPPSFAADQNNYTPTGLGTTFSIEVTNTSGAAVNVTGLAAQTAGSFRNLCVSSTSTKGIFLPPESASSTAANRFMGSGASTVTLNTGQCALLWYSGASSRWLVLAGGS